MLFLKKKKKKLRLCVNSSVRNMYDNVCNSKWLTGSGMQALFLLDINVVIQISIQILLNPVFSKM